MTPFVSGLFGLTSQNVFWDLLCIIQEESKTVLRHIAFQKKKNTVKQNMVPSL